MATPTSQTPVTPLTPAPQGVWSSAGNPLQLPARAEGVKADSGRDVIALEESAHVGERRLTVPLANGSSPPCRLRS